MKHVHHLNSSLPEVYCAAVVCVKCSEDILAEVVGIAAGEDPGVHLAELVPGQLPGWAVGKEPLVPVLNTGSGWLDKHTSLLLFYNFSSFNQL